jgi:hypothetical protein
LINDSGMNIYKDPERVIDEVFGGDSLVFAEWVAWYEKHGSGLCGQSTQTTRYPHQLPNGDIVRVSIPASDDERDAGITAEHRARVRGARDMLREAAKMFRMIPLHEGHAENCAVHARELDIVLGYKQERIEQ